MKSTPFWKQQGTASLDLIVQLTNAVTALARFNNNNTSPQLLLSAGVSKASVLALLGPLLMKVLWLDSGEVESRL